jgi:hypothetical protein
MPVKPTSGKDTDPGTISQQCNRTRPLIEYVPSSLRESARMSGILVPSLTSTRKIGSAGLHGGDEIRHYTNGRLGEAYSDTA